ncbi:hypothetical protein METP3_01296 [Methanosarcinales archaeon]|nr:hypothetical protein METP3_01296 [Methanosarcinales archaeon]
MKKRELELENKILRLEKTIAELKLALSNSSKDTYTDLQYIEKSLEKIIFKSEDIHLSALKFFEKLWPSFADGATYTSPDRLVRMMSKGLFKLSEVITPFKIRNLVEEKMYDDTEIREQYLIYCLTDTGRQFASYITRDGYTFNKSKPKEVMPEKS